MLLDGKNTRISETIQELINMSIKEIKDKINDYDTKIWKNAAITKKTMQTYLNHKDQIKQETWIRNGKKYEIMVRARADALDLKWRGMGESRDKTCPLCQESEETLIHFVLRCSKLQAIREKYQIMKSNIGEEIKMKKLLYFDEEDQQETYIPRHNIFPVEGEK